MQINFQDLEWTEEEEVKTTSNGKFYLSKNPALGIVKFRSALTAPSSEVTITGIIPSEYRPYSSSIIMLWNNNGEPRGVLIYTNGNILIKPTTAGVLGASGVALYAITPS